MMLYLEDENFLSQKDKDFINNVILGNNSSFFNKALINNLNKF